MAPDFGGEGALTDWKGFNNILRGLLSNLDSYGLCVLPSTVICCTLSFLAPLKDG